MVRSRNYCCNEKERKGYLCIVQLRIDANKIKVFSVGQQCLHSEFMSPETKKPAKVFVSSGRYFHPIVTKFGLSRQFFIKVPVQNFTEIRPV